MPGTYDDQDLDAAAGAGVLRSSDIAAFRAFVAKRRDDSVADDEAIRFATGFNDVFVAVATGLVFAATAALVQRLGPAAAAIAAESWALAEFFTRRRRLAFTSIVLTAGFIVGASFATGAFVAMATGGNAGDAPTAVGVAVVALVAGFAHWRRFRLPITVAIAASATALAAAILAESLVSSTWRPGAVDAAEAASGLALFALALWWDFSDPLRLTRRADVAFWLHLVAAPLITQSIFRLLFGWTANLASPIFGAATAAPVHHMGAAGAATGAIATYLALGLIALVLDRRAFLTSALVYFVIAVTQAFNSAGAASLSFAFAGLTVGASLLLLAAFWRPARRLTLTFVPAGLAARVPSA
ncbi:MAG: hypothetical protein KGI57_05845 [Hyphomicrobiales bacterium]|nr:hypothetical protein [Hyphomicrobiales bacterium]